ncbi:MAG TPA: hypothetical protein PKL78_06845 [Anaerolineales bacterium]|nr:hypothetical protein [Anaerolineales bacterium]HNN13259.1 hypothetical protein [Anaerolineales bacterium]
MKDHRGVKVFLILWITSLACVVPGMTTSAPLSTPTPDTRLEIMVAETVSVALQMTEQVKPVQTSSQTPTSIPTATQTAILATPTQSAESVWDTNADGDTAFTDLLGKYSLVVPRQWVTFRRNAPEFDIISTLPEAENPAIQRSLETIRSLDPNIFRLFALDMNEEHIESGFVTNINVLWDAQQEMSLADGTQLEKLAATLPDSMNGAKVLVTEIRPTKNNIPYGVIASQTPVVTLDGAQIILYQKQVFFDLPAGTLSITLSTTDKWRETVEPSFDAIVDSLLILE